MKRLEERLSALRARGVRGLAPYITAGDGGLEVTLSVLRALDAAGATSVELGLPFSDPIADGPVLQAAADRALAAVTTFEGVMRILRRLRDGEEGHAPSSMPIVIMSYSNPLLCRGWRTSARAIAEAGGDGILVADLPVEEADDLVLAARDAQLAPILFVSPTTGGDRMQRAIDASRGFVYAIGRFGVTGRATDLGHDAQAFLAEVRERAGDLCVAVGFGIRDAAGVREATRAADLAIVGSALVARVHEAVVRAGAAQRTVSPRDAAARAAHDFVTELRKGLST